MRYTITIQQSHFSDIKNHLLKDDGKERVAFIICGRSLVRGIEDRMLTRKVFLLNEEDLLQSTVNRVSWDNNHFIQILKEAEPKDYAVVVVHNHSTSFPYFSEIDDKGENNLFKLAFNRNGGERPHGSLILMPDGSMIGRVWNSKLENTPMDLIRIIGKSIHFYYPNRLKNFTTSEIFDRQKLAFGKALIQDLSMLKIAVVGAGATGSITALLLTRLGVGELILIDKDIIEESNLNRLHSATISDVGKYKVDVLKRTIRNIGIGTKVTSIRQWLNKKSFKLLKSSDVIFGCTDDNAGRILLNRFAYFYLTPVIDMGLVISVKNDPPELQDLQGRISYLFPGSDCLITKGIINLDRAYAEYLKRDDPQNYEKLKEEAYVIGEGNPAPAVVTFTTQIATLAANDLLNRLQGFNISSLHPHRLFFFHRGVELAPSNILNNNCRICGSDFYWGRGDMQPLMDMVM